MSTKVLVVCMFDSIHSARWLSQFQDEDIEFLLFPSSPHRRINPNFLALLNSNSPASYRVVPGSSFFALPLWLVDKFFDNFFRSAILRRAIRKFQPDFLHALELQNAGYLSLRAIGENKSGNLKFIATNWGSDIYWFRQFPKHEAKLRRLLKIANRYSCECERDVALAKELGFVGEVMPVAPNAGGFTREELEAPLAPVSSRKTIALKGYHGWVGRAKVALDAVELVADKLRNFNIEVYSANLTTARYAKKISRRTGLTIRVHKKGELKHKQVLDLFARSKIYVGLSLSDGISTSLLEAMAMGAIPVQTSTACCDEWFRDTGVAVHEISAANVARSIEKALELANVQENSDSNRQTIANRASQEKIKQSSLNFYRP